MGFLKSKYIIGVLILGVVIFVGVLIYILDRDGVIELPITGYPDEEYSYNYINNKTNTEIYCNTESLSDFCSDDYKSVIYKPADKPLYSTFLKSSSCVAKSDCTRVVGTTCFAQGDKEEKYNSYCIYDYDYVYGYKFTNIDPIEIFYCKEQIIRTDINYTNCRLREIYNDSTQVITSNIISCVYNDTCLLTHNDVCYSNRSGVLSAVYCDKTEVTNTPIPTNTPPIINTSTPIPIVSTSTPIPIVPTSTPIPTNTPIIIPPTATPIPINTPSVVVPTATPWPTGIPTNTPDPTLPTITPTPGSKIPVWCGPLDSYNTDGEPIGDEYIEIRDFMKFRKVYNMTCSDVDEDYGECGGNDTDGDSVIGIEDFIHLALVYRKDSCVIDPALNQLPETGSVGDNINYIVIVFIEAVVSVAILFGVFIANSNRDGLKKDDV